MFRSLIIAWFFVVVHCVSAQKATSIFETFPAFTGFKKTGYHISGMCYFPAKVTRSYGNYVLKNHFTLSGRIGLDHVFNPNKKWSLRTGLFLDLVPFLNYSAEILKKDLPKEYEKYVYRIEDKYISKFNFTVPLSFSVKKQIGAKQYVGLNIGGELMLMSNGGFSGGYGFSNDEINDDREVFAIYANTTLGRFWVYPSLKISPEFYIVRQKLIYVLSVAYKKSVVNYFTGEYQFGNLEESAPTRGSYKLSGDYFSLGLTIFLKKKKQPKIKVNVK